MPHSLLESCQHFEKVLRFSQWRNWGHISAVTQCIIRKNNRKFKMNLKPPLSGDKNITLLQQKKAADPSENLILPPWKWMQQVPLKREFQPDYRTLSRYLKNIGSRFLLSIGKSLTTQLSHTRGQQSTQSPSPLWQPHISWHKTVSVMWRLSTQGSKIIMESWRTFWWVANNLWKTICSAKMRSQIKSHTCHAWRCGVLLKLNVFSARSQFNHHRFLWQN